MLTSHLFLATGCKCVGAIRLPPFCACIGVSLVSFTFYVIVYILMELEIQVLIFMKCGFEVHNSPTYASFKK
jgi:hypothetical protein